jgi:Zn-finger nucleic acid-binding protein
MARFKRVLRARALWAGVVVLVWLIAVGLTVTHFGPKPRAKGDTSMYKFLHCDQCNLEMTYAQNLDGKRCPKCLPPKSGFMVPTEKSIKSGSGAMPPWTKVYVGTFVETVVMLGVMVYLMYLPVADPTKMFFVVACPTCSQRLRYRAVSHGGLGSCSRCKRMLRFPDESDAVSEEEVLRADAAAAAAEYDRAADEADAEEEARRG